MIAPLKSPPLKSLGLISLLLAALVACADPPETVETTTTSSTSSTTAPTTSTTTVPPTLPPAPLAALVLADTGIGTALFGDEPESVITFIGSELGAATLDTGWVPIDEATLCPGSQYRRVEWGVLRVEFGDESPFGSGRQHFAGWNYGTEGRLGEEPQGLISALGVGLGARVDELQDAYPEVQVFEGEEGMFSPSYFVNDFFTGYVTGVQPDDVVMVMFGGRRCGE
jgi:hypothetical protein